MVVKNIKRKVPTIFIPTDSNVFVKIIIVADDDTEYTVMDTYDGTTDNNHTITGNLQRPVTNKLGSFSLTLANDGGRFLRKFNGGEIVKFYMDTTDATEEVFRARIDNVSYGLNNSNGFTIEIDGRDYPELIDKTITDAENSPTADVSLAKIFNVFYSDITLTFWNGSSWSTAVYTPGGETEEGTVSWSPAVPTFPTTLINMAYQHKKGLNVIAEICNRAGLDCYIEYDIPNSRWVLRTFVKESITNINANISYGTNLVNLTNFGEDNAEIINRTIVYGKAVGGNVLNLKTENDTDSQSNLWIKDKVIVQGDLTTMAEVQDKCDFELSEGINSDSSGKITTVCLYILKPGDVINVSIPYCNIHGEYKVYSFTHSLSPPFLTTLELTKQSKGLGELFIPKLNPDELLSGLTNPNNMKDSYSVYFDEDPSIMTYVDITADEGIIKLDSGKNRGTAVTNIVTADYNVTRCELRKNDNDYTTSDTYKVTNNGGGTWETYTWRDINSGIIHEFQTSGNRIGVELTLIRGTASDPSPGYEAISLLYK